MNYKGYEISIEKIKGSTNGLQYLAKALNGSDSATGDSEEDAYTKLKSKIDAIPAYQEIYYRPYTEEELIKLVQYIKQPDNEMKIRWKLKKQHYIGQNDFSAVDLRAIYNHSAIIEKALNECNNNFTLKTQKVLIGGLRTEYILYDADYYATPLKLNGLIEKLESMEI